MNKDNGNSKNARQKHKTGFILGGALLILAIGLLLLANFSGKNSEKGSSSSKGGGDIVIQKSEITSTAKFIPYNVGGTKLEVVAIKAPDGTIRTAFNTCQVCYSSGQGYYKQEGSVLVCQNCGNRFSASQVEKVRGGCNPVPIMKDEKTEDDTSITIPRATLEDAKAIFENWKS